MSELSPWNDWQNKRLDDLRAEIAKPVKNVRAYVARERELAQRAIRERVPPSGMAARREQAEEAETLARYHAAPEHVREWLDGHIAARLAGRKIPDLFRDRVTRDVLLCWKAGELEDDDGQPQAAEPTPADQGEQRRGA